MTSKLKNIIIDCQSGSLVKASEFWATALSLNITDPNERSENKYAILESHNGIGVEVQLVTHESRVHLDIETEDIESEVKRLVGLGAIRLTTQPGWVVMQAPTGHKFCVIQKEQIAVSNGLKVGQKYTFNWREAEGEICPNSPISELIRRNGDGANKYEQDYNNGFEIIEVGKFITIKFSATNITLRFPASEWQALSWKRKEE